MQLEIITLENYRKHLNNILSSERIFPEQIRLDEEELIRILTAPNIAKAIYDPRYIGNYFAFSPNQEDINRLELKGIVPDSKKLALLKKCTNNKERYSVE
jgi:hypothetical protein